MASRQMLLKKSRFIATMKGSKQKRNAELDSDYEKEQKKQHGELEP